MQGYWGREEATADGDPGRLVPHRRHGQGQDEDGYFFIVDRKKDLIIRGGYNVYPREIEEALYEHAGRRRGGRDRHPRTTASARRSAPRWRSRRA